MSKERDLLVRWLDDTIFEPEELDSLMDETKELLAQPEQDNTQYLLDQVARLTAENAMLKEKWLAQPEQDLEVLKKDWVNFGYEAGRKSALSKQEPVAWKVIDRTNGEYMFSRVKPMERSYKYDVVIPLYTAPPKREPLSEATINYYLYRLGSHFKWDDGFEAGVKWAEKAHGIGEQK